jgi:hypothetical protein
MHEAIETDRLRMRPFISDDVQFAFDWFGDPLVWESMDGLISDIG